MNFGVSRLLFGFLLVGGLLAIPVTNPVPGETFGFVSGQPPVADPARSSVDAPNPDSVGNNTHGVRARQVEGTASPPSDTSVRPGVALDNSMQETRVAFVNLLESALAGSDTDVIIAADIRRKCGGDLMSRAFVTEVLDRIDEYGFSRTNEYFTGRGETGRFESFDEYERFLWRRHEDCTSVASELGIELRDEILALAEQGLPTARYFFATWPPDSRVTDLESSLEHIRYQELALQFTVENMEEREPLGLLALGQSYVGGSSGGRLFTRENDELGRALLLAAHHCGTHAPWLDREVRKIVDRYARLSARGVETAHEAAELLSLAYCL